VLIFGVVGNEEIISIGEGHAYGFEILNRTKIGNKFNMILAYTYVRSEFKDKNGDYIPTSWDNQHILTITSTMKFNKNWSAGLKWRYAGGLPYTPYNLELSSRVNAWDVQGQAYLDKNRINSERLGDFHQLDIRVDKSSFLINGL
jgi:outer membrane receptor for ferrienterochelin and colicin